MVDCIRALVRQIGQYGVCINHESMHLRWKLWWQFVSNLQFSPVLNLSKHTAHSEKTGEFLQVLIRHFCTCSIAATTLNNHTIFSSLSY
uniref:Uncharacterized protein n=1 Tax=Solanum lycopersicum TaxID=4081 RepID=A0A3Q7ERG8_SOLLC